MQVAKHKVVSIDYTLTNDDGQTIDSSVETEPLSYLHGEGAIISGLERALEGKTVGEQFHISVPPADGYGERKEELCQVVPRERFEDMGDLELGMQFRVPIDEGDFVVVTIVEISGDAITIDGNHVLAGITLHFDVSIRDIRDATTEEITSGISGQR